MGGEGLYATRFHGDGARGVFFFSTLELVSDARSPGTNFSVPIGAPIRRSPSDDAFPESLPASIEAQTPEQF